MIEERVKTVVRWLIDRKFVSSQQELAERIGYSTSALSLRLNKKAKITDKFVASICKVDKRINYEWVIDGAGEMLFSDSEIVQQELNTMESLRLELQERGIVFDALRSSQFSEEAKKAYLQKHPADPAESIEQGNALVRLIKIQDEMINVQKEQILNYKHLLEGILPVANQILSGEFTEKEKEKLNEIVKCCNALGID